MFDGVADSVAWVGVVSGPDLSVAVDSVKGSGPALPADWRKTSPPPLSPVPPPPRERTTARTTAATTTVESTAMRGTDFHQGWWGSGLGAPAPLPDGGGEGGPEGGWEGPDRGPEGGPVGRPDDGGSTLTKPSSRRRIPAGFPARNAYDAYAFSAFAFAALITFTQLSHFVLRCRAARKPTRTARRQASR